MDQPLQFLDGVLQKTPLYEAASKGVAIGCTCPAKCTVKTIAADSIVWAHGVAGATAIVGSDGDDVKLRTPISLSFLGDPVDCESCINPSAAAKKLRAM